MHPLVPKLHQTLGEVQNLKVNNVIIIMRDDIVHLYTYESLKENLIISAMQTIAMIVL
jgi:hypothetical protein